MTLTAQRIRRVLNAGGNPDCCWGPHVTHLIVKHKPVDQGARLPDKDIQLRIAMRVGLYIWSWGNAGSHEPMNREMDRKGKTSRCNSL